MGYSEQIMADYIFKGCPREIGGYTGMFFRPRSYCSKTVLDRRQAIEIPSDLFYFLVRKASLQVSLAFSWNS